MTPGGVGELVVTGSNVMLGYWNRPEETAEMIRMYGEPGGNRKQLQQFIGRIGEKRAELERKRLDLEKMLADLQHVEDRARATLAEYGE
mgnify:CR=1 FL=1